MMHLSNLYSFIVYRICVLKKANSVQSRRVPHRVSPDLCLLLMRIPGALQRPVHRTQMACLIIFCARFRHARL